MGAVGEGSGESRGGTGVIEGHIGICSWVPCRQQAPAAQALPAARSVHPLAGDSTVLLTRSVLPGEGVVR